MSLKQCIGLAFVALCAADASASSAFSHELTRLGQPETYACTVENDQGLGTLFTIQFKSGRSSKENQTRAVDLVQLLAPSMPAAVRWMGSHGIRRWQDCRDRDPKFVFWRDPEDNWRLINGSPARYLSGFADDLTPQQQGSPYEAYVLFSLGIIEQRLRRLGRSKDRLERANDILVRSGEDPHGIRPYLLVPLIYHAAEENDDTAVSRYLRSLAPIVGDAAGDDSPYLPLIKTPPRYPRMAQVGGETGHVLLEFTVDASGRVKEPIIIEEEPENAGFGEAAIEAAVQFRYIPRIVNGKIVSVSGVRNLITFDLVD
jgi:TonB family protein